MPPLQKELEASIADGQLREEIIDRYWRENMPVDSSKSSRLHDTLVAVMSSSKELSPVFLQALVRLAPCLINKDQLRFWFTTLVPIAIDSGGIDNGLVSLAREFIGVVLDGNHDDELMALYQENTAMYMGLLVDIYVGKATEQMPASATGPGQDERRRYMRANVRDLLLEHGIRDLEALLNVIYSGLLVPKHRLLLLQLLSELVSEQLNGKLFRIANTPVLEFLMRCIERDRSSVSVEIAATTLAMVLPHVSDKLVDLLPRLLACYGRMASWLPSMTDSMRSPPPDGEGAEEAASGKDDDWRVLEPLARSGEPNAAPLFNLLYGLFPNNTLLFCRHADDYLAKANYKLPFSLPWDRYTILEKTQDLLPQFTLHSLLISSSAEQEIATASVRFQRLASASGIMASCAELRVAGADADDSVIPTYGRGDDPQELIASKTALLAEHQNLFLATTEQVGQGSILSGSSRLLRPPTQPTTPRLGASSPSMAPVPPPAQPAQPAYLPQLSTRLQEVFTSNSDPSSPVLPGVASPAPPATAEAAVSGRGRQATQRDRSSSSASLRLRQSMSPGPRLNLGHQGSPSSAASNQPLPIIGPNGTVLTGPDDRKGQYTSSVEFYVRELLLNKNELNFANFTRFIVERKVVRLQKQLYELSIARIKIDYLSGENRKLSARLAKIEEEHMHAQRVTRARLRDRTAYETTLLDKNRELRQQIQDAAVEMESRVAEIERLNEDRQRLTAELNQLASSVNVSEVSSVSPEAVLVPSSTEITLNGDTEPTSIEPSEYEAKYYEAVMELESLKQTYDQEVPLLKEQIRVLRNDLKEDKEKLEDRVRKLQLSTKSVVADIQHQEEEKYAQLQAAHNEQLARVATLERELMARRLHEEEQINELRTTLLLSRPFSLPQDDSGEMRIRGRGGAQGTVRR